MSFFFLEGCGDERGVPLFELILRFEFLARRICFVFNRIRF